MDGRILICLTAFLILGARCRAAEVFYMDHDGFTEQYVGPVGPLVISGEIEPGDYDHLLAKIQNDEKRFFAGNKILLVSDGGDVAEAMRIGTLIKSIFTEVIVGTQTGRCVSACFLIYASAQQRATEGTHVIGINRPYWVDPSPFMGAAGAPAPNSQPAIANLLKQVRDFLQDNEVPPHLIEEMFRHPSDDAYWLSPDDENELGYRSKALSRYLAQKCDWDATLESDVYAGNRPLSDLRQAWKCRANTTSADARKALLAALQAKSAPEPAARSSSSRKSAGVQTH